MSAFRHLVAFGVLAIIGVASPAKSESCLQRFSCQLYGSCQLPCLGEVTDRPAEATSGSAVTEASAARSPGTKVRRREAHRKTIKIAQKPKAPPAELVRVVAGKSIQSIEDLRGKPVSFGLKGDPSEVVASQAFAGVGIKVQETPLDLENALDGVSTGDVAAVVLIGDKDVRRLDRLGATDLHLVSIPSYRPVPYGMQKAVIPPNDPTSLAHGEQVQTLALSFRDGHGAPLLSSAR